MTGEMNEDNVDELMNEVIGSPSPPLPVPSDYLEMVYLTILFVLGAPLNLAAYSQVYNPSI